MKQYDLPRPPHRRHNLIVQVRNERGEVEQLDVTAVGSRAEVFSVYMRGGSLVALTFKDEAVCVSAAANGKWEVRHGDTVTIGSHEAIKMTLLIYEADLKFNVE